MFNYKEYIQRSPRLTSFLISLKLFPRIVYLIILRGMVCINANYNHQLNEQVYIIKDKLKYREKAVEMARDQLMAYNLVYTIYKRNK